MRTSRNMHRNQAVIQNRVKQFRGRVGQRLIGRTKLKASSRRRFFNGVSPLNRDNVEYTQTSYTQYDSNGPRQNRFFQQREIQSNQRGYHQRQQTRGRGWNAGVRPYDGHVVERRKQGDSSFQTGSVVRGRLNRNFGFMRSDTIIQRQHLRQDLQKLQFQQQQQQHWVQKSWQQLKTKVPRQIQSSARTAIYEPSSSSTVTIQIPNIVDSSDVSVIFGKKSKRNKQNDAFARSVAFHQPPEASQQTSVKFGRRNQSVVSFEEEFDVNVETASSSTMNSSPFHLVSKKPASSTEDLDYSILIV